MPAIKGRLYGIGHPGAGMHQDEFEYIQFRPKKVREERRRIWKNWRYQWVMCEVRDTAVMEEIRVEPEEQAKVVEGRTLRSKEQMKQLVKSVCHYLYHNGPATTEDISLAIEQSLPSVKYVLRSKGKFVKKGKQMKKNGSKQGNRPWLYDLAPGWEEWYK